MMGRQASDALSLAKKGISFMNLSPFNVLHMGCPALGSTYNLMFAFPMLERPSHL